MVFFWILRLLTNVFCLCQAAKDPDEVHDHPEVNSSMGNQFLFALPDLMDQGKVIMYIYCVINPKTLVSIFTYRLNRNTSVDVISIEKNRIRKYKIDNLASGVSVGKRVTYEVASGVELGLFLIMYTSPTSVASIKMLPESHWGTEYYVYTLTSMPTVLITTNFDNQIKVVLRFTLFSNTSEKGKPKEYSISFGNGVYLNGSALKFILKQKESFSITMCNTTENFASLIGTRVVAKEPVGVISGSCQGMTSTFKCQTTTEATPVTGDLAIDTIPPVDMYGREFIMFNIFPRATQGELTVFSSNDSTTVVLQTEKGVRPERVVLAKRGDWKTVRFNRTRAITANRPVLLMFTLWSPCVGDLKYQELGDVAVTYVVPVELYFFIYLFSFPNEFSGTSYVALICQSASMKHIKFQIDETSLLYAQNITGRAEWMVMYFNITHGVYLAEAPEKYVFGLYHYGLGKGTAYISPAGYKTTPINTKSDVCEKTEVRPDDVIDNDCDGRIDEEEDNHEDDDFDGLVDEDLFIKLINGEWGRWSEWQCTNNCNMSSIERSRKCDNPPPTNGGSNCEGSAFERRSHTCYTETLCPTDCPPFKWFEDCSKSCYKCEVDCNKFTGSCDSCCAGYFGLQTGCDQECDAMAFGPNCNGSCQEKCGGPCSNTITGECPKNDYRTLTIILVVSSLVCLGCFCLPVQSRRRGHDGEDTSSSYSFSTSETEESEVDALDEHPHPHHHVHHHHSHHHSHHSHGAPNPKRGAPAPKPGAQALKPQLVPFMP